MKSYFVPQGIAADIIATEYGFSRDDVRRLRGREPAARRDGLGGGAVRALDRAGDSDINGLPILERDEHMRPGTDMQSLGALDARRSRRWAR